jgi:O-antigen biosynthesis protein
MEFTGERFVPGVNGAIELEHLHRYVAACQLAGGKSVLDLASGEGYGAAMLAVTAAKVIGVDIDETAVAHARKRYPHLKLEFACGSCAAIPLPDASIDLVVSFETIEHHDQHKEMLREIKRVLRPDGALLISSPDKNNYSGDSETGNPFHLKELTQTEFKDLLSCHFTQCAWYAQRVVYGSAIFAETRPTRITSFVGDEATTEHRGLARPVYWLALASDAELPALDSGIFEQASMRRIEQHIAEREAKIADLEREVSQLYRSTSWRVTAPLRTLKRWFTP